MNAVEMITKCRMLQEPGHPPGIVPCEYEEGYVDLRYGNAHGNPNAGRPYFMRSIVHYVIETPRWFWLADGVMQEYIA